MAGVPRSPASLFAPGRVGVWEGPQLGKLLNKLFAVFTSLPKVDYNIVKIFNSVKIHLGGMVSRSFRDFSEDVVDRFHLKKCTLCLVFLGIY